ncbi:MAG: hypothetical protein U0232_21440 [Thermomicrobiales bacterium]
MPPGKRSASAWSGGATLAGSSAGAMALAELTVSPCTAPPPGCPRSAQPLPGLGVLPHFDRFGPRARTGSSAIAPPHLAILGIDEDTTS